MSPTLPHNARADLRLQAAVLAAGALLMGIKFGAAALTGSNAMLADALESIVNLVAGAFALYSMWLAAQPRDANHPYGHGKIEFLSAGFEGTLIALAGISMIAKAAYNLVHPLPLRSLDIGLALTAFAGASNYLLGYLLVQAGKKRHSLILKAGGAHLKTDAWTSLGVLLGLGLAMLTGWYWLDNLAAITFGALIVFTAWKILRGAVAGVMDEADESLLQPLLQVLEKTRQPQWIDLHNLRLIKYGSTLHIDCHLTLPWYYSLREAHAEMTHLDEQLRAALSLEVELFIHPDPCVESSCAVCNLHGCAVRQQVFHKQIPWTLQNVVSNAKHAADAD